LAGFTKQASLAKDSKKFGVLGLHFICIFRSVLIFHSKYVGSTNQWMYSNMQPPTVKRGTGNPSIEFRVIRKRPKILLKNNEKQYSISRCRYTLAVLRTRNEQYWDTKFQLDLPLWLQPGVHFIQTIFYANNGISKLRGFSEFLH